MSGIEQRVEITPQQKLSPQMRQGLEILQAPLMELSHRVRTELEANPVLEEVVSTVEEAPLGEGENMGTLDDLWREYYIQSGGGQEKNTWKQHRLDILEDSPTLQQFLLQQVATSGIDEESRRIAELWIGHVDENGYCQAESAEIAKLAGVTEEEAARVRQLIIHGDPPGVGTRHLAECLEIQLQHLGGDQKIALEIVKNYLDLLARHKLSEIAKEMGVAVQEVEQAAKVISSLEPRPGRLFQSDPERTVIPDVFVEKSLSGEWTVRLNESLLPGLRISNYYKDILGMPQKDPHVRDYLKEKIREGRSFIQNIQQRQHTVLAIAKEIVLRQQDFLEQGPHALKPMTMSEVAEAVGVHETTVGRAVTEKYLATPFGVREMRSFFSSGYSAEEGEVSSEGVRERIAEMVAKEDASRPLSDAEIHAELVRQGIPIARRTVAKYREQLQILPRYLRRK